MTLYMVCNFKKLIIEGALNEHPAMCVSVYVFSFSCHIRLSSALCCRQLYHQCLQADTKDSSSGASSVGGRLQFKAGDEAVWWF